MKVLFSLLFFLAALAPAFAQNSQLAQQYYRDGEYEKAAELYQQLSEEKENNSFYFDRSGGGAGACSNCSSSRRRRRR